MALSVWTSRVRTSSIYVAPFSFCFAKFSETAKGILPICEIYEFPKVHRGSKRGILMTKSPTHAGCLKKGVLCSGESVSINHCEPRLLG